MKKISELPLKTKLFISFGCSVLLSLLNLVLNFDVVKGTGLPILLSIAIAIITPIFTHSLTIVALAVIAYFVGAALGTEFDIKKFMHLSACSLMYFPLTIATNTVGFLTVGNAFYTYGTVGLISFIPFYVLTAISTYKYLPIIINETSKKKNIAISIIVGIASIFLTIPS